MAGGGGLDLFCSSSGHIPISGINTPSWDSWLHRRAPTCQPLTIIGRGWIHPHDPAHAANSPHAFISLSVTVTHALHLPVYRLFSQGPCGGNDWLGGTGLFAQILEGKPPEVWEQQGRAGRLLAGTSLEGTEATVYPTDWLHPQTGYTQEPRARVWHHQPCLALPWQLGACRAGVGTTHTAPAPKGQVSPAWKWRLRCLPSSPISGGLACQALLGQG